MLLLLSGLTCQGGAQAVSYCPRFSPGVWVVGLGEGVTGQVEEVVVVTKQRE